MRCTDHRKASTCARCRLHNHTDIKYPDLVTYPAQRMGGVQLVQGEFAIYDRAPTETSPASANDNRCGASSSAVRIRSRPPYPMYCIVFTPYPSPPATAATNAKSLGRTESNLNRLAAAAMRVSAAPKGISGPVSPFLARWKRTGFIRATT